MLSIYLYTMPLFQIHLIVEGKRRTAMWCVKYFYNPVVRKLYELYMFLIILLVPVVIMTFAYFRICQELWFMTKQRQSLRLAAYVHASLLFAWLKFSTFKIRFLKTQYYKYKWDN